MSRQEMIPGGWDGIAGMMARTLPLGYKSRQGWDTMEGKASEMIEVAVPR